MTIRLTEQQQALVEQVKRFAQREVLPLEQRARNDPDYGSRLLAALGSAGMLGLDIPETYGGIGLPHLDAAMCIEEMARHSLDAAGFMSAASLGQAYYIYAFGTEEHRRRYLPEICAGKYTVAIGITEPGAGTASTALTTRAAMGERIVINGRKHYVSNVPNAGLFIIYCRVSNAPRAKGIGAILVERGTPGFSIDRLSENMAGSYQADLLFEDCEVPAGNLLVGEGGFAELTNCYNLERCGGTALVLGTAIGAYDMALEHVSHREQFGRSLVSFQAVQMRLANMAIQIQAARLMLYHALGISEGWPDAQESSMVKVFGNETAKSVSDEAIQLMGGAGYLKDLGVERRYRYVRGYSIAGGPLDIHRTMIAGWLVGRRFSQWADASTPL
ncbi:acyl-CoA dehydrogenase family protein [Paralcaligenes sp. KSB-10]|uniref:acyl-CoA dehydrogenase family protein n=1 Tax=Paralcaligenes sp. KSB-10 TaxID=2901142 RepID=UPI001E415CC5|nr:acyl-CoA dehydrogenase family protein [Paralcaligenes sp. KSB-10]UHL64048.1 acyl-CoA dehydrogenase family protein [Paralcaligenes sp. KSB-10]